MCASLSSLIIQ